MTIYDKSIEELEELLATSEYKNESYPVHNHKWFEKLADFGNVKNLYSDLCNELGEIPSQQAYVDAGMERAEKFFTPTRKFKNGDVTRYWGAEDRYSAIFNWWKEDELQTAVKKRLSRCYASFLVETTTIIQLKHLFPDFLIGTNAYLDTTAGIDIVVASKKHNRIIYVHVTSNSKQSASNLLDKKSRIGVARDKKDGKHYYNRNFENHINVCFDKFNQSSTTKFINGNPVIKPGYLKTLIMSAMTEEATTHFDSFDLARETEDTNQLLHLHYFLLDEKVSEDGLGKVWV